MSLRNIRFPDRDWQLLKAHFADKGIALAPGLRMTVRAYMDKENLTIVKNTNPEMQNFAKEHLAEAERAVIGALLIGNDNSALYKIGKLRARDFSDHHLGMVFDAIRKCAAACQKADLITVSDILRERGQLEAVGGGAYVSRLTSAVPTTANIEYYARIVKADSARRRLAAKCTETLAELAKPSVDPLALRERLAAFSRDLYSPDADRAAPWGDHAREV